MSEVFTAEPFLLKPSKSRRYPKIMVKNGKRSLLSSVFAGRRNHGTCHKVLETAHRLRTDNANQHNKNTHAICTGLEVTRIQVWRRSKHIKTIQNMSKWNQPLGTFRISRDIQGHPGTAEREISAAPPFSMALQEFQLSRLHLGSSTPAKSTKASDSFRWLQPNWSKLDIDIDEYKWYIG